MTKTALDTPIQVQATDLPLSCPNTGNAVWNLHPKVFLDVTKTGSVKCPYCGTLYQLDPDAHIAAH